jgi:Subtilase family
MRRKAAAGLVTASLIAVALLAAVSQGAVLRPAWKHAALPPGSSPLMAFGGRSAEQLHSVAGSKLDAALADLTRHASRVRPGYEVDDLHSLSPAARFAKGSDGVPRIAVDAVTRGDPQRLKAALVQLGLQRPAVYANDVGGWLPVSAIAAAAALPEVAALRAALSHTRAAPIATQGDFTQGSAALRGSFPALKGSGVTVGILSDSFNCYGVYDQPGSGVPASGTQGYAPNGFADDDAKFDESNGYVATSVNVLEEATCLSYGQPLLLPFTDEGRAMLQIVHAVAPGAALAFYTSSNSEADFANGIGALAAAGATVIADDTGYFDEPFFQDGILAQAIDAVEAKGVAYFSAAGNNGHLSYENTTPSFGTLATSGPNQGEYLLNFDATRATTTTSLPVTIPVLFPGEFVALVVEWDQPYLTGAPASPGTTSSINLCVSGASGYTVINLDGQPMTCTGPNITGNGSSASAQVNGGDAVQVLILGNPASASGNTASTQISLQISLAGSTPAPGRIKVVVEDNGAGSTIDKFMTNSPTLQGHPGAAGAAAVAAAFFAYTPGCGTTPAVLETFSAEGGEPILFNTSGARLATPVVRQKPDFTGPDGVNTSFFGFFLADSGIVDSSSVGGCQNDASYLNFFGTSAATPHAAGAAALMRQANAALTPAQIYQSLRSSASPMGSATPNFTSGYGFLQVEAAMASLPAPPPVLKLAASTIYVGYSTTLSWVAAYATSCNSSWSGQVATSGTLTLNPATTGTYPYTLTCTSPAGSQSSTATLTVQAITPLLVTTSTLPAGQVGMAYSATLAASGGVGPYNWSLDSGTLPPGLALAANGTLSGTPAATTSGTALTFKVSDAEKTPQSKTAALSLSVAAAPSSGGGGALDEATVLALSGVALLRLLRSARRGRAHHMTTPGDAVRP